MEESVGHIISGKYEPLWVICSIIIAILASYSALEFSNYVSNTAETSYKFWLACGAICMGIGIWSMHFVGMLAFKLPIQINYNIPVTLLSLAVAIVASCFALFMISRYRMSGLRLTISGVIMGLGIAAMHYTGMAAMEMNANIDTHASMSYQPTLLLVSILFSIMISIIALWLTFRLSGEKQPPQLWQKLISAVVMGFAIAGMHYIGMAATEFKIPQSELALISAVPENTWLVTTIVISALILLILSLAAIRIDQFITQQADALNISQMRNKQIMDNAADTIITINELGIIQTFNRAGANIFGYNADEVIGTNISGLMSGFLNDCICGEKTDVVGNGIREITAMHKNGTTISLELSISEMLLTDNSYIYIGIMRDIGERKRNEEALTLSHARLKESHNKFQETHQQLLQSEKMASIGQLAAGVAHEINNPIGYVSSNIGTLQNYITSLVTLIDDYEKLESQTNKDSDALKYVQAKKDDLDFDFLKQDIFELLTESRDGISRVKGIVQDLKDFSHVDENEWQHADLHKGLNSTLNIVNNEIKYHTKVIKEYGDMPLIECMPSQLNQVFMNLLVNASHAIENQGIITIRTGHQENKVWIAIEDNGKGIPEDEIKRIFEPFYTTKPVGVGTGLGLSVSYSIIQKHNGQIDITSAEGQGTCFKVWLPIAQNKDKEVVNAPATETQQRFQPQKYLNEIMTEQTS